MLPCVEACNQIQAPWSVPGFALHNTWWPMHYCATGLWCLWGKSAGILKFWFCFLLEAENQREDALASKPTRETGCFHEKAGLLKRDFWSKLKSYRNGGFCFPPFEGTPSESSSRSDARIMNLLLTWWNGDIVFHCPALAAVMSVWHHLSLCWSLPSELSNIWC